MGDGAPYGRDSVGDDKRGRRQASPLHREQLGDEARVGATRARSHPARIQHGSVSFVRGGVPYRPKRGVGKPAWATARPTGAIAWATTSVAPTPGTARRRGPRRGDPRGRPSRSNPARLRFLRTRWRPVPTQTRRRETGMGDGAPYGRDSVGDDKRGRRQAWATTSVAPTPGTARRRGPRRGDPCGRPSRDLTCKDGSCSRTLVGGHGASPQGLPVLFVTE